MIERVMRVAVGLYQVVVGVVIAGGNFFRKSSAYRTQVDVSTCSVQDRRIVITIIHSFLIYYPRGIIYRLTHYQYSYLTITITISKTSCPQS